jgi:hypothetical protein
MPHYIVREPLIVIRYIEAATAEEAVAKAKEMAPSEYDELECLNQAPEWLVEEYDPEG